MMKDISILIGGAAGQGIQTIGSLLTQVCHAAGLFIFSMDDFQSRIRGGHNFHLLRVSNQPVSAPNLNVDIIVAIDENTALLHQDKINPGGIVLLNGDQKITPENNETQIYPINFDQMAKDSGGQITVNSVAAGSVLSLLGASFSQIKPALKKRFGTSSEQILKMNIEACKKGFEAGEKITFLQTFDFTPQSHTHKVMTGAKAAALGALMSDCRFFPFYPMSPATSIISNASAYQDQLPVVIEQAEDEIAAINMAIGASFAGIRSLTATSGGGFCLMTEALGLAAMTETPIVIIEAQRPGPSTGLATRTAQADLLFAIHASHDEFPRFVFAPGGVLETFETVKRAFYLSEKYQVPAIVLMDQFLADSSRTEPDLFQVGDEHQPFLNDETNLYQDQPYLRYRLTKSGVSPRQTPCNSDALVRAAGNEHTQEGLTTEDPGIRTRMVDKRFKKQIGMKQETKMPSLFCQESAFSLVGWGSSKGSIMEACLHLREEGIDVGWIIFEDLWPLDEKQLKQILENKKMIMVEGNATSQLGSLINLLTGIEYHASILKYDGRPFFPEYIMQRVRQIAGD